MKPKEQADWCIEYTGTVEKAIIFHKKIMNDIEKIYPSKEECIKKSMSYGHLQEVLKELEKELYI